MAPDDPVTVESLFTPANQPGLSSQPHPGAAVSSAQPGPAMSGQYQPPQPGSAGLPVASASGDPSAPGAMSLVPATTYPGDPRLQDMLDNMVLTDSTSGAPTFKVNFPHMLQDPVGNMRRFNDPRYRLAHDIPDLQWDDINLNLSSQVDIMIPNPPSPRPPQQIVQPYCTSSGTKYGSTNS